MKRKNSRPEESGEYQGRILYVPVDVDAWEGVIMKYRASDVQKAMQLALYCARHNKGDRVIKNARNFSPKEWCVVLSSRQKIVKDCPELWHFEGDDLVNDFLDSERIKKALSRSKVNSENAQVRWMKAEPTHAIACAMEKENRKDVMVREEVTGDTLPHVSDSGVVGGGEVSELTPSCSSVSVSLSCGSRDGIPSLSSPATNSSPPFGAWVATLCGAVPAFADYAKLPEAVEEEARKTYEEMPNAIQYAELLRAYYADKRGMNEKGKAFWRPTGALFFSKLGDVVHNHAKRWAQFTGWGEEKKAKAKPRKKPEDESNDVITPEQWEQFKVGNAALFAGQDRAEAEHAQWLKNQQALTALAAQEKEGGALKAAVDDAKEEEGQRRVSTGKTPWDAEGAKVQAALEKADGVDGEQGSEEEEGEMTVVQYVSELRRVAPKLCGKLSVADFVQKGKGRLDKMSREQPELYVSFPILIEYVDEDQLTQEWVGERFIDGMPALIGVAIEWKKRRVA